MSAFTVFPCCVRNCPNAFVHPDTDECGSSGKCSHLLDAGWCPALVRIYDATTQRPTHLYTEGAWLCPRCKRGGN